MMINVTLYLEVEDSDFMKQIVTFTRLEPKPYFIFNKNLTQEYVPQSKLKTRTVD